MLRLFACAMLLFASPEAFARPPKLAVLLVVDGLRVDALTASRRHFKRGGLGRFFAEGAFFAEARIGQAVTHHAGGHAAIATGCYGYKNGVAAARWFNRATGKSTPAFADLSHPVLEANASADDETSPVNLVGETIGDRLRVATDLRATVVAAAADDGAAVALAGRTGTAFWFSTETGRFSTSTWYTKEPAGWVKAFNDGRAADAWFGKSWERALKEAEYTGKDDAPYESDARGLGRTFPHPLTGRLDKPGPEFYSALAQTPMADELVAAFARAAIVGEGLGKEFDTDLLAVGFGAVDAAGHAFGPESHEYLDAILRVDGAIADVLAAAEKAAGRGNLVAVLAAGHGIAPTPERMAALGFPAGRIGRAPVQAAVNGALAARYGAGEYVAAIEEPWVYFNEKALAEKKADPAAAAEAAGEAALGVPGIAAYLTGRALAEGRVPNTALGRAAQLAFFGARAGDVLLLPRPFYLWAPGAEAPYGSAHGSHYRYDTHVPVAFWGAGVRAAVVREAADLIDIAPTLANLLGVGAPACADGRVRAEALK